MSLGHRLAMATQLRCLMKDLGERLSLLVSKDDALPIIEMLAGIIDEEILLQGVALADGGCVKLLIEESEFQMEEDGKHFQGKVKAIEQTSDEAKSIFGCGDVVDTIHELVEREITHRDALNEMSQEREPVSLYPISKLDLQRSCTASSCDIFDDSLESLTSELSKQGNHSIEPEICVSTPNDSVSILPIHQNHVGMRFYEVSSSTSSQHSFFLIPNVNFCICEYYQKRVLENMEQFTCSHFLATWLSSSLRNFQLVPTRAETLEIIARHLSSRTQEFY